MYWYPRLVSLPAGLVFLAAPIGSHGIGTPANTRICVRWEASCPAGAPPVATAYAIVTVRQVAGSAVIADGPPSVVLSGQTHYVPITVRNCGNGTDSFSLSCSSTAGWAVSLVRDGNADGIHQEEETLEINSTGGMRADSSRRCFAKVTVPYNATSGDTVRVTAVSKLSPTTSAVATIVFAKPIRHTVGFTSSPAVNPGAVDSGGSVQCSATAADSIGHAVIYAWSDGGAGGEFSPSATSANPIYTAKANRTGTDQTVTLTCTASCSQDGTVKATKSAALTVRSESAPEVMSISPADSAVSVAPFADLVIKFNKPMDRLSTQNAVVCTPALKSPTCEWSADSRTLIIRHAALEPCKEYACTILAGAVDASGIGLSDEYAWSFTTECPNELTPSLPGDFNGDGVVDSDDLARFNQEWVRWHNGPASYDPAIDAWFDLAPRSSGVWPEWSPLRDGVIDIDDATAFTESYLGSKNPMLYYSGEVKTYATSSCIYVSVTRAPYGMFAAKIPLPPNARIDPSTDAGGNLQCVDTLESVTVPFFSEYHADTRTVRMAGGLASPSAQFVAMIHLY
jgi:hypothetical protein